MHGNIYLTKAEIIAILVDHLNSYVLGHDGAFECDAQSTAFQITDGDVVGIGIDFVPRPDEEYVESVGSADDVEENVEDDVEENVVEEDAPKKTRKPTKKQSRSKRK